MEPDRFFSVTSDQILEMDDLSLIQFADEKLGIVVPVGSPRGQILTRIFNAAYAGRDGA